MRSRSTAIASSSTSPSGEATLYTRKGLDWTEKFAGIASAAAALPDCIIDGEVAAFDSSGTVELPRAAGGALRG